MAGFGVGDDDNNTKLIQGLEGSTETTINVIDDGGVKRLATDAKVALSAVPADDVFYLWSPLRTSGGNDSMDVNGSGTPQDFFFQPASGDTCYVTRINFLIFDPGTMDVNDFGAIAGTLSNGVQIIHRRNGVEREIANLRKNAEISKLFESNFNPSSQDDFGSGFLDTRDVYVGTLMFEPNIIIDGNTNDRIIFRIRDNLAPLTEMTASVLNWGIIT